MESLSSNSPRTFFSQTYIKFTNTDLRSLEKISKTIENFIQEKSNDIEALQDIIGALYKFETAQEVIPIALRLANHLTQRLEDNDQQPHSFSKLPEQSLLEAHRIAMALYDFVCTSFDIKKFIEHPEQLLVNAARHAIEAKEWAKVKNYIEELKEINILMQSEQPSMAAEPQRAQVLTKKITALETQINSQYYGVNDADLCERITEAGYFFAFNEIKPFGSSQLKLFPFALVCQLIIFYAKTGSLDLGRDHFKKWIVPHLPIPIKEIAPEALIAIKDCVAVLHETKSPKKVGWILDWLCIESGIFSCAEKLPELATCIKSLLPHERSTAFFKIYDAASTLFTQEKKDIPVQILKELVISLGCLPQAEIKSAFDKIYQDCLQIAQNKRSLLKELIRNIFCFPENARAEIFFSIFQEYGIFSEASALKIFAKNFNSLPEDQTNKAFFKIFNACKECTQESEISQIQVLKLLETKIHCLPKKDRANACSAIIDACENFDSAQVLLLSLTKGLRDLEEASEQLDIFSKIADSCSKLNHQEALLLELIEAITRLPAKDRVKAFIKILDVSNARRFQNIFPALLTAEFFLKNAEFKEYLVSNYINPKNEAHLAALLEWKFIASFSDEGKVEIFNKIIKACKQLPQPQNLLCALLERIYVIPNDKKIEICFAILDCSKQLKDQDQGIVLQTLFRSLDHFYQVPEESRLLLEFIQAIPLLPADIKYEAFLKFIDIFKGFLDITPILQLMPCLKVLPEDKQIEAFFEILRVSEVSDNKKNILSALIEEIRSLSKGKRTEALLATIQACKGMKREEDILQALTEYLNVLPKNERAKTFSTIIHASAGLERAEIVMQSLSLCIRALAIDERANAFSQIIEACQKLNSRKNVLKTLAEGIGLLRRDKRIRFFFGIIRAYGKLQDEQVLASLVQNLHYLPENKIKDAFQAILEAFDKITKEKKKSLLKPMVECIDVLPQDVIPLAVETLYKNLDIKSFTRQTQLILQALIQRIHLLPKDKILHFAEIFISATTRAEQLENLLQTLTEQIPLLPDEERSKIFSAIYVACRPLKPERKKNMLQLLIPCIAYLPEHERAYPFLTILNACQNFKRKELLIKILIQHVSDLPTDIQTRALQEIENLKKS